METLLPFALLCFTSFFTLTNPLGTMPVFLTMTQGMTEKERRSVVRRATFVSFLTLMLFVLAGQFLFQFFGLSTNGFRIAGGVIIFKIGFDMLQARYTPMKLKDEEIKTYADDFHYPVSYPYVVWTGCHCQCYRADAGRPYHRYERHSNWYDCFDLFYYLPDTSCLYPTG